MIKNTTYNEKGTYEIVNKNTGEVIETFRLKISAIQYISLNRYKNLKIVKVK